MYFEIGNFVENLKHMGVGMLTIFIVIGVIMICVYLFFLDKDAVFKKQKQHLKEGEINDDKG